MDRRRFGRTLAGAAVGVVMTPRSSWPTGIGSTGATRQSSAKLSVMLWTVLPKASFERRLESVAEAGYHAVELVDEYSGWSDQDFRKYAATRESLGLTFDAMAGLKKGIANPQDREAFLSELGSLLPIADKLQCKAIIVLSGDITATLTREQQHDSCVEGLKRAVDLASKRGITLLLENIDPKENPHYYLTSVTEGFEMVRKVGHPQVKFLYDFYHEQIAEGNLIEKLEGNIDSVGVVHVADVPGRHAPGTGEINYTNIFRKLAELKYGGYIAMEFLPEGEAVTELRAAREMAEQNLGWHR
jgi:hydroxypyruvate isomerase